MNLAESYLSKWSKKSDTYTTMRGSLNSIARVLRGTDAFSFAWDSLRFVEVRAIPARLLDSGLGRRSVNKALSALRGVLEIAWLSRSIPDEDYRRIKDVVKNLRGKARVAGRALDDNDVKSLDDGIRTVSDRDAALIVVLYICGLRRIEVVRLRGESFDAKAGRLFARGKGDKERSIPVAEEWREVVQKHWSTIEPQAPAFLSKKNKPLTRSGVSSIVESFCKTTGVKRFTPHDLRRSFATHVLDRGGDIAVVQRLMGHESLDTTTIYDRRGEEAEDAAVSVLRRRPKDETP